MAKVALIEAKPSRTDYNRQFGGAFEFDRYQLCSDPGVKKVLKKDCDIDIDVDAYDWIILVGSEALRYYTKYTAVTEYSGRKVGDKFLPVINPAMLGFKPEAKPVWEKSKENIINYISGFMTDIEINESISFGLEDVNEINNFLKDAIKYDCPYYAIDTETSGLYPRDGYVLGISLCYDGKKGAYLNTDSFNETTEFLLKKLSRKKISIFHNSKFDIKMLQYHFGMEFPVIEDTMLLHYLIDERPGTHGLKALTMKYTEYGNYEDELYSWIADYCKANGIKRAQFTWDLVPFEVMKTYAGMDALCTFLLFEKFKQVKKNVKLKKVYDDILIPGTRFLIDIEEAGVPFDVERLTNSTELMQSEIDEAIHTMYKDPRITKFEEIQGKPFNPNSVMQLRKLLFDYLGLRPTGKKTGTGAHSTDAEVLEKLARDSEVPNLILNIRQKSKIKNTYLDKIIPQLDADGRLRTGFNLHTTTSGRLSSSGKLNMQQIPRDNPIVKGCIRAPKGYKIVAMDLTTAEMYVAAVLSGDEVLKEVFRAGGNFHSSMAHKVFNLPCSIDDVADQYGDLRQAAKAVSFGILYGAGPERVSEEVTKSSGKYFGVAQAKEVIEEYFNTFPKLKRWIDSNKESIRRNGYIYSYFGRKRRLPNVKSSDRGTIGHEIRSGLNFLVQSVASDINLLAAIDMNQHIKSSKMDAEIFALVHDSILAIVKDEDVDEYVEALGKFVKMDRGLSIPGVPVGADFDVGEDYSMGKYAKKFEEIKDAA